MGPVRLLGFFTPTFAAKRIVQSKDVKILVNLSFELLFLLACTSLRMAPKEALDNSKLDMFLCNDASSDTLRISQGSRKLMRNRRSILSYVDDTGITRFRTRCELAKANTIFESNLIADICSALPKS